MIFERSLLKYHVYNVFISVLLYCTFLLCAWCVRFNKSLFHVYFNEWHPLAQRVSCRISDQLVSLGDHLLNQRSQKFRFGTWDLFHSSDPEQIGSLFKYWNVVIDVLAWLINKTESCNLRQWTIYYYSKISQNLQVLIPTFEGQGNPKPNAWYHTSLTHKWQASTTAFVSTVRSLATFLVQKKQQNMFRRYTETEIKFSVSIEINCSMF